ncbi:MAG: Cna B-type domain-containing protein, partial [Erysipelotrichaceae bacterium]|nr:Cna B-type domain-containing protein [Erysipelotrichaceae bacterium]
GKRPESLSVLLKGTDGSERTVTLSDENSWTETITGLPVYADGAEIKYTWYEGALPEGYVLTNTEENGTITTLTNSYTPGKTAATIIKVWADKDNQDGVRPDELKVDLLADGKVIETVTLNADNKWTATVADLDEMAAGKKIVYTWAEDEAGLPEGYVLTDTSVNGTVTTLTNSRTPEETDKTVEKVWDDKDNQDGKRPESLKVVLKGTDGSENAVTLNEDNGWTATVKNLPVYAEGAKITYTWYEDVLPEGYVLTNTEEKGTITTLTNSYTPGETAATIVKIWDDKDNQDGKRPEELKVDLLSNGKVIETVTLNADNNWSVTVTGLPEKAAGRVIKYTWAEDEDGLPEGYVLSDTSVNGTVTTITNSYVPTETYATVKKVWDDAGNQDHKRPEELKVDLLADGVVVNTVTLNADNKWTATVTGLPEMAAGKMIKYTWAEDEAGLPEGYALTNTSVNGYITTLTNTYAPETTEATIVKIWDDKDNQDGKRPATLMANLKANGNILVTVTLSESNGWTAKVEDLPVYEDGNKITYTWAENEAGLPEGYELTDTSIDGTITSLTNTYMPEETTATVVKVWADKDDQDAKRPESLTVELKANDKVVKTVTLDATNSWSYKVEGLPMYENGKKIDYTWAEDETGLPEGYKLESVEKDGTVTTITNSYKPEETERTVVKVWDDKKDQDGNRPASLAVMLKGDDGSERVVTLDANNEWTQTVTGLPKYNKGVEIKYYWIEAALPEGYVLTNTEEKGIVTTITNSYVPGETAATVLKVWADKNNQDAKRPTELKVDLLADGVKKETVTLNDANNWTATVTGLDEKAAGKVITYTWAEDETGLPEGYTLTSTEKNGTVTTLTNTYTPETVEVPGKKTWVDNDDEYDLRPTSITIRLYADGVEIDVKKVTAADGWSWTFTDLPKYKDGVEIVYTVAEDLIPGYTTLQDGYNFTNTITTVKVSKVDITNEEEVPGALLQIFDKNGNKIEQWISTETPHEIYGLKVGETYTLREKTAPEGYTVVTADTTFVVNSDGSVTATGSKVEDGVILVADAPTKVSVSKVDITDQKELPGAHIQIIDNEGNVVTEWDSTETPHEITGLKTNVTYTLHETIAPDGYTIAADTTFVIDEKGNVTSSGTVTEDGVVLVEDWPTKIYVSKVDITNQKEVAGAHIQIIDAKGKVVEEWDSNGTPHEITGLNTNETYTLHETIAPDGFTIAADTTFVIDENGNVTSTGTVTQDGIILVEDAPTKIHVSKVDITNQEELPGAHIQILDKDGKVVVEWISTDKPQEIEGLKTNETYTLHETIAPDGFTIAADTTFVIDEKGNVTSSGT